MTYINICRRGKENQITAKEVFKGNPEVMVRGMEDVVATKLVNLMGIAMKFITSGSITMRVQEQNWHLTDVVQFMFEVEYTGIGIATGEFHHTF